MKLALLALFVASVSAAAQESVIRPLIVGGDVVPAKSKTYLVGLRETSDGMSNCGGSLISPTKVLTAAHCVRRGYYKFAAVGTHFLQGSADGERIKIAKTEMHPLFNETTLSYDVAVVTLASPATAKPVSVSTKAVATVAGEKGLAIGWGQISDEADQSDELLSVELKIYADDKCKTAPLSRAPDDSMLCAGGKNWKDTCKGDSGGPLVIENKKASDEVVGIVSWGDGCGIKGKPSVFAQVAKAVDFIKKNAPDATFV